MKILIISDTHDHVEDFHKVLAVTKGKVDCVIHCGDACAPFMYKYLGEYGVPVHIVWGNTNDKEGAQKACPQNVLIERDTAELTLDGKRIYVNHYPENAQLATSKAVYDVVCFGHTHEIVKEKQGTTWVLNPGAIMSEPNLPGKPRGISYLIYDTFRNDVELFEI